MRQGLGLVVALAMLVSGGCVSSGNNSNTNPTAPTTPTTPTGLNLAGTWAGDLSLLGQTPRMTWVLSQTSSSVTGPVTVTLSSGTVLLNGFLTGTLSGSTLTYTIAIGPGGIPTQPACAGQLGGTTTASIGAVSTLTGNYALISATCTPPLAGGNLTLTRQ